MGFYAWIDNPTVGTNIQSDSSFSSDSQRTNGFEAGTTISSIRMNTALRQCSLVTAALMNLVDSANTLNAGSSVSSVQNKISNYLSSLTPSIQSVPNVSLTIAGKTIGSIFESDGITAKKSTTSKTAEKLGSTTVGNTNNPIYLSSGTPQPCSKLYEHCVHLSSTSGDSVIFNVIATASSAATSYNTVKSLFASNEKRVCSGMIKDLTSDSIKICYGLYVSSSGLNFMWTDSTGASGTRNIASFGASWTISDIVTREVR